MTKLNADDQQAQLIAEVGDPNGTVSLFLTVLWVSLSAKSADLQYLYAKRAMLDIRLAEEQPDTDLAIGRNDIVDSQSQRFAHLQQMRDDCQTEIVRIEAIERSNRGPVAGVLSTVEPQTPPCGGPDSNWSAFRGSPYYRRAREW